MYKILFGISIILFYNCQTPMFRCVDKNGCTNNSGTYVTTDEHKDVYTGNMKESETFNFGIKILKPFGNGKITYGPQIPGYTRRYQEGESYEGNWSWINGGFDYHEKGVVTTNDGTKIDGYWYDGLPKVGSDGMITFSDGRKITGVWGKFYLCSGNCTDGYGKESSGYGGWILSGYYSNGSLNGEGIDETNEYIFKGKFLKRTKVSGIFNCKVKKEDCLKGIPRGYQTDKNFQIKY